MSEGERRPRWRFRVEQHQLGPRVYFLGRRWHDWHLGAIVLGALAVGALFGLVHRNLSAPARRICRLLADREGLA